MKFPGGGLKTVFTKYIFYLVGLLLCLKLWQKVVEKLMISKANGISLSRRERMTIQKNQQIVEPAELNEECQTEVPWKSVDTGLISKHSVFSVLSYNNQIKREQVKLHCAFVRLFMPAGTFSWDSEYRHHCLNLQFNSIKLIAARRSQNRRSGKRKEARLAPITLPPHITAQRDTHHTTLIHMYETHITAARQNSARSQMCETQISLHWTPTTLRATLHSDRTWLQQR